MGCGTSSDMFDSPCQLASHQVTHPIIVFTPLHNMACENTPCANPTAAPAAADDASQHSLDDSVMQHILAEDSLLAAPESSLKRFRKISAAPSITTSGRPPRAQPAPSVNMDTSGGNLSSSYVTGALNASGSAGSSLRRLAGRSGSLRRSSSRTAAGLNVKAIEAQLDSVLALIATSTPRSTKN
jgi:hypothetical protein